MDLSGWLKIPENIDALKQALQIVIETGLASAAGNADLLTTAILSKLDGWTLSINHSELKHPVVITLTAPKPRAT